MRTRLAAAAPPARTCSCRRAPTRTPSWCRARRAAAPVSPAPRASSPCASPSLSRSRSRACRSSTGEGRCRGTEPESARASRANELRVVLPQLATGAYRITYSTVSQDDLHATRGAIVFGAGTAAPAARASDAPTAGTSITESVAHLFDLISLSLLIGITALLACSLPVAVRARITRFALVALPALLLAGVAGPRRQVVAGPAARRALRHPMGSRDTRAGARDRDRADRARDTPAEARARAARARRSRRGRERPRRVARRAPDPHDGRAHPRRLPLGRRSHRAGARPARARATRRARDAHQVRPSRCGRCGRGRRSPVSTAPGGRSRVSMRCSRRPTAGRSSPSSPPSPPPASSGCSDSSPCAACGRRCDCCEPRRSPPSAC